MLLLPVLHVRIILLAVVCTWYSVTKYSSHDPTDRTTWLLDLSVSLEAVCIGHALAVVLIVV